MKCKALCLIACVALLMQPIASAETQVSNSDELFAALSAASDGDTIRLQAGKYSEVCGIRLNKSLQIIGTAQVELSCGAGDSHFRIDGMGTSVTLSNLAFMEGHSETDGGCLHVSDGANVDITGCSFFECAAVERGGALSADASTTVRIVESTFFKCHAAVGGALSVRGLESTVVVESCNLLNNTASEGGGILVESASLEVRGSTIFSGNMAQRGGGIAARLMENSTHPSTVSISSGATFQENFAVSAPDAGIAQGGGIYLVGGCTFVCLGAVTFVGNEAHSPASLGGAVYISGGMALVAGQTTMQHNTAAMGGAVWVGRARVELREGVLLSHNTALLYGGGIYATEFGTLLRLEDNVRVEHCVADRGGGILIFIGVVLQMYNNVDLVANFAAISGGGLSFFRYDNLETRGRVRFLDNVASDFGGGFTSSQFCFVNFTKGTIFKGNSAGARGGGASCSELTTVHADGVEFTDNTGTGALGETPLHGGGLRCQECTAHVSNCYFARNHAGVGAGIYWKGTGSCTNNRFEHNSAEVGGGFAHMSDSPMTFERNTFYNNSALNAGGCIYSAEASVFYLGNTTFASCSARNNGAALAIHDEGAVYVSGSVTMTDGSAGAVGGGIHHQGKLLHVQPGAALFVQSNSASGGGGISYASTVTVGGLLRVIDNVAREGDGGGFQGSGVFAITSVSEGGWLEVSGNEAAAANGGGVALLANARFTFDFQSVCPTTCEGLGDGGYNPNCLYHQCRWDAGDFNEIFLDAAADVTEPCAREGAGSAGACPLVFLSDTSTSCAAGCISARCEWGFDSVACSPASDNIGQCPYINALIYRSILTTDVRYIKDGGTAGGFGRCNSDTCSPADASIGRDEPYCTTLNDGGNLIELDCPDCLTTHPVGESWGPCAPPDKPRLPGVGFDYDPAELLAVLDMDIPSVLRAYPGCGYQPIAIRNNRAALAGGGVYKDGCDGYLESRDRCFVGELDNNRLPSIAIDMSDNEAGGPGGGFFVECGEMAACMRALEAQPGLPARSDAPERFLHFGEGSAANAYGHMAAGLPVELRLVGHQGNMSATPGQTLLDVRYELLDKQGLVVRGSSAWPNPHVVEVAVCRVGEACTATVAVQPAFLLRSHPTDASTTTLRAYNLLAVCPVDDPRVEVHVKATGDSGEGLHKSLVMNCEPCGPGQELVLEGEGATHVWSCRSCQPTDYVITPAGGCQACPLEGAYCDGKTLTPTVPGAEWVAEGAVMRLQSCPAGYILVRDPAVPVLDACVECPPGKFSVAAAIYPDVLTVSRASEAPLVCAECVRGADCLGGEDIISMPGFWEDKIARQSRRTEHDEVALYQCPPGACEGNNSCSVGRHGAVCGLCMEGWGRSGITCVECGTHNALGKEEHYPSFIITVLCGALLLYLLTWRPLVIEQERALRAKLCGCSAKEEGENDPENEGEVAPTKLDSFWRYVGNIQWTSPAMIGAFKVAISFYQVASTFNITFRIAWPDSFALINSLGRLTGLDLSLLLPSVACLSREYDHVESLIVFTTVFPLVMMLLLCLPYLLTRALGALYHGGSTEHPKHEVMQRYCLRAVLLWLFLIYPTVSEQTLTTFFCEDLGSGGHVLVLDKSVDCPWGGSSPSGGFYFALFLVFLYPVGIPAFFYYVVSAFFVPAMAQAKYRQALVSEMLKLFCAETKTPISVRIAQHVGMAPGSESPDKASPAVTPASRHATRAASRLNSEVSESAVPLRSFKRRVSQLFTQTFVQRELSGLNPSSSVHDKLQHVLDQFECDGEELTQLVAVLQRLSISTAVEPGLDEFEQLALKIAHNHFLFSGHETLEKLTLPQLHALFLFDWEGLNRKRSEQEIRKRHARRQRAVKSMNEEQLRAWVLKQATKLEKSARITVPSVNWNGKSAEEERALVFVGFLFDDFRVPTWWFFLVGEFCKLVMTSLLVFIPGRFWQQLAWGFFVQVCVTALYAAYQPMAETWLNHFQLYALTIQSAILFFGLCLAVSDEHDPAQQAAAEDWATLLVLLKWTMILFPLAEALVARAGSALLLTVQRAVRGEQADEDDAEREPSCLERLLFPTAANTKSRLRRTSTFSAASLRHSTSLSDTEFLGIGLDFSAPHRRRLGSSVEAQLGSTNAELPGGEPGLTPDGVSPGPGGSPPSVVTPVAAASFLPNSLPQATGAGVQAGPHCDPTAPENNDPNASANNAAAMVVEENARLAGGPVPVPGQTTPRLELSVVPTPRK